MKTKRNYADQVVARIKKRIQELKKYQPQIRKRHKGFLDMRDQVDKMRDDEYWLLVEMLGRKQ